MLKRQHLKQSERPKRHKQSRLEVAICYLHGKYGVEIRIMSINKDNSHSWVRISHGLNKFVMNLNNKEQELPEVQLEDMR